MKGRPILSALLAGALVLSTLGAPALAAEPAETRQEAARHAAELAMSYGGADSVQYALWEDGEITLSGSVGTYSRTEDRALTEEDLYGIGSVSKMYITAAVLALCEEGELSLEDPVAQVLPGFTMADERYSQITVEMLLDHSAGFMGTARGTRSSSTTPTSRPPTSCWSGCPPSGSRPTPVPTASTPTTAIPWPSWWWRR